MFKNRSRVETQPRCKIQYPMKNHNKDAGKKPEGGAIMRKYFFKRNKEASNKRKAPFRTGFERIFYLK
jgi:hypothetical protein